MGDMHHPTSPIVVGTFLALFAPTAQLSSRNNHASSDPDTCSNASAHRALRLQEPGVLVVRQKGMVLSTLRCRVPDHSSACATSATPDHHFTMPLRLQCWVQRMALAVGQGLVRCQENLLLQDGAARLRF